MKEGYIFKKIDLKWLVGMELEGLFINILYFSHNLST